MILVRCCLNGRLICDMESCCRWRGPLASCCFTYAVVFDIVSGAALPWASCGGSMLLARIALECRTWRIAPFAVCCRLCWVRWTLYSPDRLVAKAP